MKIAGSILMIFASIFVTLGLDCPSGWVQYDNHNTNLTCQLSRPLKGYRKCIKLFGDEAKAWDNARKSCKDVGGKLIKIETKDENTFLLNTFLQIPSSKTFIEAWIGLSDKEKENTFVWTDGTPQSNKENCTMWADDQPNDEDDQDCVEIANGVFWPGGPPQIGVWNDFQCDKQLKYICEKNREEYLLED